MAASILAGMPVKQLEKENPTTVERSMTAAAIWQESALFYAKRVFQKGNYNEIY